MRMSKGIPWLCLLTLPSAVVIDARTDRRLQESPRSTLVGLAVLPAATWSDGPPCGEFDRDGRRRDRALFPTQPVQGFSSIRRQGEPGGFFVLTDNGFGNPANSPDYLLRIYRMRLKSGEAEEGTPGSIDLESYVQLNDRDHRVPFRIINEGSDERNLTGADFDPESMVVLADGTFWIGDEYGPYLLHFDNYGTLIEAPFALEIREREKLYREFKSPNNPTILALGASPEVAAKASVANSGGFEGLALMEDGKTLLAMLEKGIRGDPFRRIRMFEFDLETHQFTGKIHLYRLSGDNHRLGELTLVMGSKYLVIERDNAQGEEARFKSVFAFDLEVRKPDDAAVDKTEVIDLLRIDDPARLATDDGMFSFPFVTIESVEVVDNQTLLVANDNNFDTKGARGVDLPNDNEVIWVRLSEPLF